MLGRRSRHPRRANRKPPRDNPQGYPENNFPVVAAVVAGLIVLLALALAVGVVSP